MDDYIPLSTLNDFIFCPYSIYLHSVYMETDGDLYKASPQTKGTLVHQGVDEKKGSTRKSDIMSLPIYCDELGISGKIDVYKQDNRLLIERKNNLKRIFRGQIYQLWGQYFCLKELEKQELVGFIEQFKRYNPASTTIQVNPNKCIHCIYCNLCDKTNTDNVYT